MESYSTISNETWMAIQSICKFRSLHKYDILYSLGDLPRTYSFVYSGLLRLFVIDKKGNEYNKKFFDEGSFPGSMAALLTSKPSQFTIEALEPSSIIEIDFSKFRELLIKKNDLKLFQIYYLEKNWLLEKDSREVEIIQEDATQRYHRFMKEHPTIVSRLTQYHIASHLGITPTQLSRIRKNI